jgi:proton glutamate symport protein
LLVFAGLIAGLAVGALIRAEAPQWTAAAEGIEAFGGLWLNTLRMTVIPLVVSLLITGIASVADAGKTGGLVLRAILLFTFLILFAATYSTLATNGFLSLWPVDRGAAEAFITGVGDQAVNVIEPPTFASWLQGLAPYNPVKAAAEDGVLALVVFSVFFGFATTRLTAPMRDQIVSFFRAVSEAMIVIVHWVLLAGPIGVFALALGVGLHTGFGAAGTLAQYVVIVTSVTAGITVIAWIIAITWGGQPIGRFTTAATPVWAIAASTQSSLASLPAMLDAALRGLRFCCLRHERRVSGLAGAGVVHRVDRADLPGDGGADGGAGHFDRGRSVSGHLSHARQCHRRPRRNINPRARTIARG